MRSMLSEKNESDMVSGLSSNQCKSISNPIRQGLHEESSSMEQDIFLEESNMGRFR